MEAGGGIRPLRRDDIPALVALRHATFERTETASPDALASYLEAVLLGDASRGRCAPSLVFEDAAGHLAGFVGMVPRTMALGRRAVSAAVVTQLMVARGAPGLVGRRLARAAINAPYDLILSDAANDAARRLWESVGGRTALAHSLAWRRPLRTLRAVLVRSGWGTVGRAAARVARPLCAAGDALLGLHGRSALRVTAGDEITPFDITRDLAAATAVLEDWPLHPMYDAAGLRWIIDEVAHRWGRLPWQLAVRDRTGRLLGWALYAGRRGGCGEVVQLAARRGHHARVLPWLFSDAHRRGLVELRGRVDPAAIPDLARTGATFVHEGPWMLVHSRHRDVMRAIDDGRAFLSRLEGEWWMRF